MAGKTSQGTKETLVANLCKNVSIPKGANVLRLPGPRPSAVAAPFRKPPMNWSTPGPLINRVLPPDEAIIIVSNDPLNPCIFTEKNPSNIPLNQVWLFSLDPLGNGATVFLVPGQTPDLATDLAGSQPNGASRAWHGALLFAKLFKGSYWNWCDCPAGNLVAANGAIVISTFTIATLAADGFTVAIYRLNEGDEVVVFQGHLTPGVVPPFSPILTATIAQPDYYRVIIVADSTNLTPSQDIRISNQCIGEIEVHLPLPDLVERQMQLVQSIRVTGAASHAMNLVSEQNATGSWVGDQPEAGVIWTTYLRTVNGINGFTKLSGQQGNEIMELKKFNPYTFVTPEDKEDWEYVHPFTFTSGGQVSNINNRALDEFHYTIVYLKSGGQADTPDLSRNLQLEFFYGVEYTTDGIWPMLGTSPLTEDDEDAAIKVLASIENITHNPGWKEIVRTIGKYVRLSAPVLAMLGPYGKAASVAASGVGEGIGQVFGYRTKKTARQEEEPARDPKRGKVEELAPGPGEADMVD